MKEKFELIWYYVETRYTKLLNFFNFKKDSLIIPKGMYCYEYDEERNIKDPSYDGGYWIKTCKYYRSTSRGGVACTFTGYFGFDPCLYDQCKICSENELEDVDQSEDLN